MSSVQRWKNIKLKYLADMRSGNSITSDAIDPTGLYPVYGGGALRGYTSEYTHEGKRVLIGRQGAHCGNVKTVQGKFWASEHAVVVTPNSIVDIEWLSYLLESMNLNQYSMSAAQPGLAVSMIKNLEVLLPAKNIQERITKYINTKVSSLEEIIEQKGKLIQLLDEKRQSMITETVTKGLNPNVKMKDSGVEWIGKIPEHWHLSKMKYLGEAITGLTYSPADLTEESGTIVLRSTNIQKGTISLHDNVYVDMDIPDKLLTRKNDILICSRNGSRNLVGKNALIQEGQEGHSFGAFTTVFRSKYNNFIYYVLNSGFFAAQLGTYLTTTINQLTLGNLNNMEIVMPPIKEQMDISEYLTEETMKVNELMADIEDQIKLLTDYRQSLIYEAVTGKIDVRDFELVEK